MVTKEDIIQVIDNLIAKWEKIERSVDERSNNCSPDWSPTKTLIIWKLKALSSSGWYWVYRWIHSVMDWPDAYDVYHYIDLHRVWCYQEFAKYIQDNK